jgi:hypothetical protein
MVVHHLVERPAREAMRRQGVPFLRDRTVAEARIASVLNRGLTRPAPYGRS